MSKKYKILLLIITILLVGTIIIGTSYSLWSTTNVQEGTNEINVGCFKITFSNVNSYGGVNAGDINLINAYPISEEVGSSQTPYMFSIKNECSIASNYIVNLETLNESNFNLEYLRVKFNDVNNVVNTTSQKYSEMTEGNIILTEESSSAKKLISGYLAPGEITTYSLRVWIDNEATVETENVMGKTWKGKVVVSSEAETSKEKTVEDTRVAYISDGTNNRIHSLTIKGNTENNVNVGQDGTMDIVVSGKNLIKKQGYSTPAADSDFWLTINSYSTPLSNGWLHVEYDNTSGTSNIWPFFAIKRNGFAALKSASTYSYYIETKDYTYTGNAGAMAVESGTGNVSFGLFGTNRSNVSISRANLSNNNSQIIKLTTLDDLDSASTNGMRSYYEGLTNSSASYDFRAMLMYGDVSLTDAGSYEPYKEHRYTIVLKDTAGNTINGLSSSDTLMKVNGVWVIDNGSTQTELSTDTQNELNSMYLYEGISNVWVDGSVGITNISISYTAISN